MGSGTIWLGFAVSALAGLATGLGALPVLFTRDISDRLLDVLLGFSAGVMLAAAFFSLLVPAMNSGGLLIVTLGVVLGALVLHMADRIIPHLHPTLGREGRPSKLPRIWLLVLAITIHNFPEGLAVGVSFGAGEMMMGMVVAIAIALQNMPEGLAVALPMVKGGYSRRRSLGYSTLTGLVEPIGGLLGLMLMSVFHQLLPWMLAFAAGAMLFVVSDEMIPESHRKGFEREATFGFIAGFIVMMILDSVLA